MSTAERIFGGFAVTAWLAIGASYVWPIAGPDYSDANKARIFLIWLAAGICIALWVICEKRGRRMSFIEFVVWGGGLGVLAGIITWGIYALGEKSSEVIQGSQTDLPPTVAANSNDKSADSGDLDFYFFASITSTGGGNIHYGDATVTNRSPRKMHLEMWGHVDYWKDNAAPGRLGMPAEWIPDGVTQHTGTSFIDLAEWETKKGTLLLSLGKPEEYGLRQWHLNASKNVYFHAFESVTGKHIAFKAKPGYPRGKMPWPLPSHRETLALAFPEAPASARSLPALEPLDLLARTQFFGYRNDSSLSISAVLTNRSSDRMKLQINLLTRKSVDDKEWRTFRGVLVPSGDKKKDQLDYYALDFGPGDVADCSLVFANTGFTNKIGEELEERPSVSLLEIFDEVSRKKVWCAIEPGYPPGTDMRWAAIQPPPAIPKSDSDNIQKDESNDSK